MLVDTLSLGAEMFCPKHTIVTQPKGDEKIDIAVPDGVGNYHMFTVTVKKR
jgi:hypothetical protein